jgi:RND family efflux transporter MFP subunit
MLATRTRWLALASPLFVFCNVLQAQEPIEGLLETVDRITVSSSQTGVVTQLSIREGDVVQRGQAIAKLDDAVLRLNLARAKAKEAQIGKLNAADEELRFRSERLGKIINLARSGHATEGELQQAMSAHSIAKSSRLIVLEELDLQRLEVERIGVELNQCQVLSPIDGVVEETFIERAEMVTVQDSRIATIINTKKLQVKLPLPLDQRTKYPVGKPVMLEVHGSGKAIIGYVSLISPVADPRSETISVTVAVDNEDNSLTIGSRCSMVAGDEISSLSDDDLPQPESKR